MATIFSSNQTQPGKARVFIYTLSDPESGQIRYVGKALDLHRRLKKHINEPDNTRKSKWIQSLKARGLKPIMEVLEEIIEPTEEQWQEAERYWIESMRCLGFKLTNLIAGGYGTLRPSLETLEKCRLSQLGRKHSAETKEKMRQAALSQSPEKKARISATKTGVKRSQSFRDKMRIIAMNRSPETRAKIREGNRGKIRTPESRLKQSLTIKSRPLSEAQLAGLKIGWTTKKGPESYRRTVETRRRNSGGIWNSTETKEKIRVAKLAAK